MNRVVSALVGLIATLFGLMLAPGLAPMASAVTVAYDSPHDRALSSYITSERGPPGTFQWHAPYDGIDIRSHGTSARHSVLGTCASYDYDNTRLLVQSDIPAGTTGRSARADNGVLSSSPRWRAAANAATRLNRAGRAYPNVIDPRTGSAIHFPGEGLTKVPVSQRAPWGGKERGAYIKQWYDRGYSTPEGGWSGYDVHHIRPREYGGTNDFDNLVPIPRDVHQQQFNSWWRDY